LHELGGGRGSFGIDYNIDRRMESMQVQAHSFAQASPYAIAHDGAAHGAADRKAHTWACQPLTLVAAAVEHGHVGGEYAPSFFVHTIEGSVFQQPRGRRKAVQAPNLVRLVSRAAHGWLLCAIQDGDTC
jgi:hypothetical protein